MNYNIFANKTLIGATSLNIADSNMGVYEGRFKPTQSYSDVRHIFLLYAQSAVIREKTGKENETLLQQFFREREKLNLSLRSSDNVVIPTSWILIEDFIDEIPGGELEIQVQISDLSHLKFDE